MSYPLIINGVAYGMVTPKEEHYCNISAPETEIIKAIKKALEEIEQHKTTE